jgi:hypothetical protein
MAFVSALVALTQSDILRGPCTAKTLVINKNHLRIALIRCEIKS